MGSIMKSKYRKFVLRTINNEVTKKKLPLNIYGSFKNDTFHLDTIKWVSFSDIDIVSSTNLDFNELKTEIENNLSKKLNINFEISIRGKKIHNRDLNWHESYLIAQLEFFYKITRFQDDKYLVYQLSKFILRVIGFPYYFDNPLQIGLYSKNGLNNSLSNLLLMNKLNLDDSSLSFKELTQLIYSHSYEFNWSIADFLMKIQEPFEIEHIIQVYSKIKNEMPNRKELILDAKLKTEKAIGYCN